MERPILFSREMVRAILDGRKTQTRRVVKPQPQIVDVEPNGKPDTWGFWCGEYGDNGKEVRCTYGVPGDRLWVRETWGYSGPESHRSDCVWYRAGRDFRGDARCGSYLGKWRPSIHMPRWASRITLEVTEVRVERVQDITEDDAKAEGCTHTGMIGIAADEIESAREEFARLWDSINAERGFGWNVNPWVWCVSFRRLAPVHPVDVD